jgi:hypothetical protein
MDKTLIVTYVSNIIRRLLSGGKEMTTKCIQWLKKYFTVEEDKR